MMLISGVSAIFWQVAQKFDHETCIVDQDVEAGMQIQNGRRMVGEFETQGPYSVSKTLTIVNSHFPRIDAI